MTGEYRISASRQAVSLNDARFQFGDATGNGAVNITLGDVIGADIAVSISHLDLDAMLAASSRLEAEKTAPTTPATAPSTISCSVCSANSAP